MNPAQDSAADTRAADAVFFLSYARTPVYDAEIYDPEGDRSPDYWVNRFWEDLTAAVHELLPDGRAVGFMDVRIPLGSHWSTHISDALAECRTFVALYSPRYFTSVNCGREWAAVEDRIVGAQDLGQPPPVRILPVLWTPVRAHDLPAAARRIQSVTSQFSDAYREFGVSGLIRLARWQEDYRRLLHWLADQIAADARALMPERRPRLLDYRTLRNAFEDASPSSSVPQLGITVLAPDSGRLPPGRDPRYYGPRAVDWRPFAPTVGQTLAGTCLDVTRSLAFEPLVQDWHTSSLVRPGAARSPGLLLVDPWAVQDDAEAESWLRRFDEGDHESTAVLVVAGAEDRQSAEHRSSLNEALLRCLPRRLARTGPREHSIARIDSLEQLGRTLPAVTSAAAKQFLRQAKTYPPKGDPVAKPRLRGPAMNPPAADGGAQPEGSAG